MTRLKIGVVSCRDRSFPEDLEARFSRTMKGLSAMAEELGFDLYLAKTTVYAEEDARQAVRECEKAEVDFLLLQLTACPANGGTWIPIFADISRAKLGIWAIPEGAQEGPSPVNSFVGLTFYAGILGHYIKDRDVQFKWFFGEAEDPLFRNRFAVTVRALSAIKRINASRIGLVGGVPIGFGDLAFDERNIRKIFPGLKIIAHNEYREIKERALGLPDGEVAKAAELFVSGARGMDAACCRLVDINVRMTMAYRQFAAENGFDALALNCMYGMGQDYSSELCAIVAELNDCGIVTSCEGDMMGAISMLLMKYLTGAQPSLMDFPSFDAEDDSILMWHCGSSAKCFACDQCYTWEKSYSGMPIIRDLLFKAGHVTIARISGEADGMLIADGNVITNKKSFLGSRGWIGDLRLNRKPIGALDFVNTVLENKFHHHYPIVFGDVTNEMSEIASWLRLKPLTPIPYQEYLQNKV